MLATTAAAAAAAPAVASPMPVRQIQFPPPFRPSLPQQSRLVGLHPISAASGVHVAHGLTHTHSANTQQLQVQVPTHEQQLQSQLQPQLPQLQPQLRSQLQPGANAEATAHHAVVSHAVSNAADIHTAVHVAPPQTVLQAATLMPSAVFGQKPLEAAAPDVAATTAPPHPEQLPQQLPPQLPQQVPHLVAPMPHITWPSPVVSWPHQLAGIGQAQDAKGHHVGMQPPASTGGPPSLPPAHPGGRAPLQRGVGDPDRAPERPPGALSLPGESQGVTLFPGPPLQLPLPPAGSAPLQRAAVEPNRPPGGPPLKAGPAPSWGGAIAPLEPSLPQAGSAPMEGGTLAPAVGGVPEGVAAQSSGQSWEGARFDAGASASGNAMPPNKR